MLVVIILSNKGGGEMPTVDYLEPICALSKVPMFLMKEDGRYCHRIGVKEILLCLRLLM